MKVITLSVLLALALTAPVFAQQKGTEQKGTEHSAHHPASAGDMVDGEVRKVDPQAAKITIRHGEIKNLDMPAMTMVFNVKDKAVVEKIKAGDKVKFKAAIEGGQYFVTELQLAQ